MSSGPEPGDWAPDFFARCNFPWSPEQRRLQAGGIERLLKLRPGAALLDVACGDGGLAVELASRGFQVTGLDLSDDLLKGAEQYAQARGVSARWVAGDMRELPWEEEFDAVLSFCWAFGYFDDEGNRRFLTQAFRALKPDGKLLVDTHVLETLGKDYNRRVWRQIGERLVLEDRLWNHETGRVETIVTEIEGGQRRSAQSFIRVYTYRELSSLLREVGFQVVQGYSGTLLPGQPYGGLTTEPFVLGITAARHGGEQMTFIGSPLSNSSLEPTAPLRVAAAQRPSRSANL